MENLHLSGAPRGVTIRMKTHIGFGTAQAAIRVYIIISWLQTSSMDELPSFRRLLVGLLSG